MLPRLENSPVNRRKGLLIDSPKSRHDAQRVPRADSERLTADGLHPHSHQRVHDLSDATKRWITRIKRLVERLSSSWDHVLVKAEPVHICTTANVAFAIEEQLGALTRDVRVSSDIDEGWLREGREDLGRQRRAEFGEERVDDGFKGREGAGSPGSSRESPAACPGQGSRGGDERKE